jgi:hypothetical protein
MPSRRPDHGPCWRMHSLGTVPERAGAGQPRYRSEPDPCTSAASGAPIGTTSPGGTRSLVLPGHATCPKWHGPGRQVECTPKPSKQEAPAPAPLERLPCGPLSLLAQRPDAWPGGLPCPWNRGTVDTVACRETTRGKRWSQRSRPDCINRRPWVGSGAGLVGGALAAGSWACQHRPASSLHPGRGGRTRLPPRGPLAGPFQASRGESYSALSGPTIAGPWMSPRRPGG